MAQAKYTAEEIQVLEEIEAVRKRPAMYIGGTGKDGYHHLLWEIVDNSIDEVINKHATKVEVTLHKNGKSVRPFEKLYRPTDREPFMNDRQRDYFRMKLLDWRDDILKEAKETLQHLQDDN